MKRSAYQILIVSLILSSFVLMFGCSVSSGGSSNNPPTINLITAEPAIIDAIQFSRITVEASDIDGDSLTYSYTNEGSASGTGEFTGTGSTASYDPSFSASYPKSHILKAIVSDGKSTAIATVEISVSGACFVAGTKVHTRDGLKNIEEIVVGDSVYSYDRSSGKVRLSKVVTLIGETSGKIYTVSAGGNVIKVTGEHPFYVEGRTWVTVKNLNIGDILKTIKDGTVTISSIASEDISIPVYNLSVDGDRNYFVMSLGILVHNK